MMDAKLIALAMTLTAAIAGVGLFIVSSGGATSNVAATTGWDGCAFALNFPASTDTDGEEGDAVVAMVDVMRGAIRFDQIVSEFDTETIVHTESGEYWAYTTHTETLNGKSFKYVTICYRPDDEDLEYFPKSAAEFFGAEEGSDAPPVEYDGEGGFTVSIGNASNPTTVSLTLRDGVLDDVAISSGGDVEADVLGKNGIGEPIFSTSVDPSVFDVPAACNDGGDPDNKAIMRAAAEAREAEANEEGHRRLATLPPHLREEAEQKLFRRETEATLRGRMAWSAAGDAITDTWNDLTVWVSINVLNHFHIDMEGTRYCGPGIEGCAKDNWVDNGVVDPKKACGGPVSDIDACCAFHDFQCGFNSKDTKYSRGASASAEHSPFANVFCPGMHGGSCEHCSCTAGLATCSKDAMNHGRDWLTAKKVNSAFSAMPCWHKWDRTYKKLICKTRWKWGWFPIVSCSWQTRKQKGVAGLKNGATYGKNYISANRCDNAPVTCGTEAECTSNKDHKKCDDPLVNWMDAVGSNGYKNDYCVSGDKNKAYSKASVRKSNCKHSKYKKGKGSWN